MAGPFAERSEALSLPKKEDCLSQSPAQPTGPKASGSNWLKVWREPCPSMGRASIPLRAISRVRLWWPQPKPRQLAGM